MGEVCYFEITSPLNESLMIFTNPRFFTSLLFDMFLPNLLSWQTRYLLVWNANCLLQTVSWYGMPLRDNFPDAAMKLTAKHRKPSLLFHFVDYFNFFNFCHVRPFFDKISVFHFKNFTTWSWWSSGSSWSLVSSLPEPHQYWSSVGILAHKSWLPTSLSLSVTHWPTLLLDCLVTLNTLHRFLIILNIFLSFNVSLNFFLRVVRLNLSLGLEFSRERISQQFHRFLLILNSSVNFIIYCLVNTQNLLSSTHYKLNLQSMTDETYVNGTYHMKAIFRMKGIMHCYCYCYRHLC